MMKATVNQKVANESPAVDPAGLALRASQKPFVLYLSSASHKANND